MAQEAWEQFADSGAAPAPGPAAHGKDDRATVNDDAGSGAGGEESAPGAEGDEPSFDDAAGGSNSGSDREQRGEATSVSLLPGSPPPAPAPPRPAARPGKGESGTGGEPSQTEQQQQGELEQLGTPPSAPSAAGGVVDGSLSTPVVPAPQPAPASPAVAGPPPPQPLVEGAAAPTIREAMAPSSDAGPAAALAAPSEAAPGPAPETDDGSTSSAAAPAATAGLLSALLGAAAVLAAL